MTRQEAYNWILSEVKNRDIPHLVSKRVSKDELKEWCSLTFNIMSTEDAASYSLLERECWEKGITFDTGFGFNGKDWELGYSLQVAK
jgi:hypothetical protein